MIEAQDFADEQIMVLAEKDRRFLAGPSPGLSRKGTSAAATAQLRGVTGPMQQRRLGTAMTDRKALERLKSHSLLYVEDDKLSREELASMLEPWVGELRVAADGRAGLELFKAWRPDVVITDIQMPGMSGLALCGDIRQIAPDQPIIVLSAYNDVEYLFRAIELGVDHYITKPVSVDRLLDKLAQIANRMLAVKERHRFQVLLEHNRAVEGERKRLAREVHDQIGQVFTAIKLITHSLRPEAFPPDQEAALAQALDMGIAATRKITSELRPPLLDDLGLAAALDHLSNETAKVAGLSFEVDIDAQASLDSEQALTLFRIAQESVTNILRHARATHVAIIGRRDLNQYVLCIEDDGCGFALKAPRPDAMGLKGMKERALLLRGSCEISPRPRGGTSVTVSLPLADDGYDQHPAA